MNQTRVDEIRTQMQQVRCEMGEDVQQIVESARTMTDWHYYVNQHPWICLAAATAVGYMLVPNRVHMIRPDADALAELAGRDKIIVKASPQKRSQGVGSMLAGMVAKAALRGATAYFAAKLTKKAAGDLGENITGTGDDAAVAAGSAG